MKWITNEYEEDYGKIIERPKLKCRADKKMIKGRPQATKTYTIEELESMDMIGIYEVD